MHDDELIKRIAKIAYNKNHNPDYHDISNFSYDEKSIFYRYFIEKSGDGLLLEKFEKNKYISGIGKTLEVIKSVNGLPGFIEYHYRINRIYDQREKDGINKIFKKNNKKRLVEGCSGRNIDNELKIINELFYGNAFDSEMMETLEKTISDFKMDLEKSIEEYKDTTSWKNLAEKRDMMADTKYELVMRNITSITKK